MRFLETPLEGAWIVDPELNSDERGFFARTYDELEFSERGLAPVGIQCSTSLNTNRGTLRGLHFQTDPHAEPKLVRCTRGAIWDVGVDLRRDSPSYRRWHAIELNAENRHGYYLPAGIAHGFQTLADDSEVLYMMGTAYVPEAATGVRWNDPALGIEWPEPEGERTISARDQAFPDFQP